MGGRIYHGACGIGLGHAARSLEVAELLRREGWEVLFSTYGDGASIVDSAGFPRVSAPSFEYWVWPDGTVDPWRTLKWMSGRLLGVFAKQVAFELRQIASYEPDVVFSDSRLSTVVGAKLAGRRLVSLLNQFHLVAPGFVHYPILPTLSDIFSFGTLAPLWGLSDLILVPDFPSPYTISEANLRVPPPIRRRLQMVGPIVPLKPEKLEGVERLRKKYGFDGRPLVYASVSGPDCERRWLGERLLRNLSQLSERYQAVISLGLSNASHEPSRMGNLTIFPWIPARCEVLKACDLVIARGGHGTVTHSLAYGKPMLLLPAPEQTEQILNAKRAASLGVARVLDQRRISAQALLTHVETILDSDEYAKRAEGFMHLASKLDALDSIREAIHLHAGKP